MKRQNNSRGPSRVESLGSCYVLRLCESGNVHSGNIVDRATITKWRIKVFSEPDVQALDQFLNYFALLHKSRGMRKAVLMTNLTRIYVSNTSGSKSRHFRSRQRNRLFQYMLIILKLHANRYIIDNGNSVATKQDLYSLY